MSRRDDLLRAMANGKDPYYAELQNSDAYARELQKLKDTKPDKSWIQSPFQLPRFTDAEFEQQRQKYQEKYGSRINVPGFEDVIQWHTKVQISNEDMAAHKIAQRQGLPSPLTDEQLAQLTNNKNKFLRMLQAPEGEVSRAATAVMTATDNANDALFTFAVLGQLATYLAPKALSRAAPIFGWAQGAADVLNLVNVAAQITKKSYSNKRLLEKNLDSNPFHKKFWSGRVERFGKKWPGLGELLQIPQVTQSMFGVGLCLGGIMGTMNDVLTIGTEQVLQGVANIIYTAEGERELSDIWGDTINSASIVWNAKDWVDEQTLAQVTLAASLSLATLMPTWIQTETPEFLDIMQAAGSRQKPAYHIDTKYLMDQFGIDPEATPNWPMFDAITVPMEDIAYTYGPRIKDNFTEYLLENEYTPEGVLTGQAATDFHGSILATFSDDHQAQVSQTAIAGAGKDLAIASLYIPPETSQATIEKLTDWIQKYERDHGSQPTTKEIQITGIGLGINWTRRAPSKISGKAAELWPGWQAIQDQLQNLHLPNYE